MLAVFTEVVLPVIVMVALGGAVGRWRNVQVASLAPLVFYLFGPALVFRAMSTTEISAVDGVKIAVVMCSTAIVMIGLASTWSTIRGHAPDLRAGVALAAMASNAGNMGLPVATLAFGEIGLQVAVVSFVVSAIVTNSAGVAVASMSSGDLRAALVAPLRYPYLYAGGLGVVVRAVELELPTMLSAPLDSLSGATVPVMLVILGLQLRNVVDRHDLVDTVTGLIIKLAVAPAVAFAVSSAMGMRGVERDTLTVLAGMPTAVVTTILATQFDARPDFVSRAVITSTVLSMVSLTALITLVR